VSLGLLLRDRLDQRIPVHTLTKALLCANRVAVCFGGPITEAGAGRRLTLVVSRAFATAALRAAGNSRLADRHSASDAS
jgi:hypothetical protein